MRERAPTYYGTPSPEYDDSDADSDEVIQLFICTKSQEILFIEYVDIRFNIWRRLKYASFLIIDASSHFFKRFIHRSVGCLVGWFAHYSNV